MEATTSARAHRAPQASTSTASCHLHRHPRASARCAAVAPHGAASQHARARAGRLPPGRGSRREAPAALASRLAHGNILGCGLGQRPRLRPPSTHAQGRHAVRVRASVWVDLDPVEDDPSKPLHKLLDVPGAWGFAWVCPEEIVTHDVHWRKAYHYAKEMEAGAKFPPVQVGWGESAKRWKAHDGAHRVWAARLCGKPVFVKVKRAQPASAPAWVHKARADPERCTSEASERRDG